MTSSTTLHSPANFGTARHTDRRGDLTRLALLLMIFLNAVLGVTLLARDPASPLSVSVQPDITWHGNAGPVE